MHISMGANLEMVKTLMAHGVVVKQESPILDFLRDIEIEYQRAKSTPVPVLSRQQAAMVDWIEKSRSRRAEIAQLLKAAGAKESERDQEPVDYAQKADDYAREAFDDVIERNDIKDFERLLAAYANHPLGAAVLPDALRLAVNYSRVEMVKSLLARGVNPNLLTTATKYTPLMFTVRASLEGSCSRRSAMCKETVVFPNLISLCNPGDLCISMGRISRRNTSPRDRGRRGCTEKFRLTDGSKNIPLLRSVD